MTSRLIAKIGVDIIKNTNQFAIIFGNISARAFMSLKDIVNIINTKA